MNKDEEKIYKVVKINKATRETSTVEENITREKAISLAFKLSLQTPNFTYKVTK